jgi:diadenosine tetraphosphate (Ap4A) HIT family hydrolase
MGDLKKQLTALSKSHEPEARRVMKAAESVAEEVANEKKSPSYLRVTLDGLKKAAETVKDVAPNVIVTASKIADFVHQWWPS